MFDCGGYDVISRLDEPEECQVVTLGAAAGEHYFCRAAVQQLCNAFPRVIHRRMSLLALLVNRRCIAKPLKKMRTHRLKYFRQKRGGSVVVEIHAPHGLPILLFIGLRAHTRRCAHTVHRKNSVICVCLSDGILSERRFWFSTAWLH